MIALADVGHDPYVAGVEAQALAQDAAAGRLQDRRLDLRVEEHGARTLGSGAVVGVDTAVGQIDAVGAGHPDEAARDGEAVGDQPGDRGLAVGAGDRRDGDTAGLAGSVQGLQEGRGEGTRVDRGDIEVQRR